MALDRKIWPGAFGVVLLPLIGGVAALLQMLGTWQQDVTVVGQGIIICGITWVVVWLYQRHVTSRRRGLSGTADALANFIDVFHPEQAVLSALCESSTAAPSRRRRMMKTTRFNY